MRPTIFTLLLFVIVATAIVSAMRSAQAAGEIGASASGDLPGRTTAEAPVDDHDESRVGVQLAVAGAAAGLVVGVGTAAYLLRRKLGLTAYPDHSPDSGGNH